MQLPRRLMFVLPLILATCAVALLNGNVLCMAGPDHIAVEARHEPAGCPESDPESGPHPCHDDHESGGGPCTDVSADLDLLRSGNRSSVDSGAAEPAYGWSVILPNPVSTTTQAGAPFIRTGLAPPPEAVTAALHSIVLII